MQKELEWLLREKYNNKPTEKFKKDVRRIKMGKPLDYVIGFTEFLGCRINLSKKPLIPRPETEYWVEKSIYDILIFCRISEYQKKQSIKIFDIFAGSGCIGIAILKHIKNATVTFAEKYKSFIKQIKINCKINNIDKKRYKVVQSDIFSNIAGKYDYIFANPPYISKNRANKIQKSVLQYEPRAALFGGKDGLFYIRKFLAQAKNFLNDDGKIYMEFDSIQKEEIEKLLKKLPYKKFKFFKDQYGKWRWVVIKLNN